MKYSFTTSRMLGLIAQLAVFVTSDDSELTVTLPSSCKDLSDGYHYIQIMSDDQLSEQLAIDDTFAPIVKVKCSNGHIIINPTDDTNIQSYFSSFHWYHTTFAGPDLDDHVNWKQWWLPSRNDVNMIWSISEDCQTCSDSSLNTQFSDLTVYHMTADAYGCNSPVRNLCDFSDDTLECYKCSPAMGTDSQLIRESSAEIYGKCGHITASAASPVHLSHSWCTEKSGDTLPSIGTVNQYCVCYQPSLTEYHDVYITEPLPILDESISSEQTLISDIDESDLALTPIYLSQNDFLYGTYRITQPGTYIITEDIEFDFNSGDLLDPNAPDGWYPTAHQSDMYPGAGSNDGWYWLGFFAGITVEVPNVIIDLGGFEIRQSPAFYMQQRWFIGIELASKPFLDGQGPTWTGAGTTFTSGVTIKNGIIGLSSHAGIHGLSVTDCTLMNLHIQHFETHGIAINEFHNLNIENVEIGPGIKGQLGLTGYYNLGRIALPVFRESEHTIGNERMLFKSNTYNNGEAMTVTEMVDRLERMLDMAFAYAYFGDIPSDDTDWIATKELFLNPSGISRSGVIYGLVLRPRGASVLNYGTFSGGPSDTLLVKDVYIHDLTVKTQEYITLGWHRNTWVRDTFNAPVAFEMATDNGLSDPSQSIYTGNVITDLILTLRKNDESWWHLGRMAIPDQFVSWAESGEPLSNFMPTIYTMCGFDSLGHIPKGVIGMKIEYVESGEISNVRIENLQNLSPLGSDKCGSYVDGTDGGMPLADQKTNRGYGGTHIRGISMYGTTEDLQLKDISIKGLISKQGPVHGLYIYNNAQVSFENIEIKHLSGGVDSDVNDLAMDNYPNLEAESCAFTTNQKQWSTLQLSQFRSDCLTGHSFCYEASSKNMPFVSSTHQCEESYTHMTAEGNYIVSENSEITFEDLASLQSTDDTDSDADNDADNDASIRGMTNEITALQLTDDSDSDSDNSVDLESGNFYFKPVVISPYFSVSYASDDDNFVENDHLSSVTSSVLPKKSGHFLFAVGLVLVAMVYILGHLYYRAKQRPNLHLSNVPNNLYTLCREYIHSYIATDNDYNTIVESTTVTNRDTYQPIINNNF